MGNRKIRLDQLVADKGLAESRSQAQLYIMAGQVQIAGQVALKPSVQVDPNAEVTIDEALRYVSRGGQKLEAALVEFKIVNLANLICADVGASTGGFTDCMLEHGAKKVYAIDVGKNILHWKLRTDDRVVVMEKTNARFVEALPEKVDFVTIDVSFISLETVLPVVKNWLKPEGGRVIALIKPQFEAGRKEAAKGRGVIRDPEVHRSVLSRITAYANQENWGILGLIVSPITGPKGNIEFLINLEYPQKQGIDAGGRIEELVPDLLSQKIHLNEDLPT